MLHTKRSTRRHDLTPEDLLERNIDKFRPLYDEYLDITNDHLDAAVEYIKMLPKLNLIEGVLHATSPYWSKN